MNLISIVLLLTLLAAFGAAVTWIVCKKPTGCGGNCAGCSGCTEKSKKR